jgi:hypothetical protein
MIAKLRRPGTASRNSSSLLPAVSANWVDRQVIAKGVDAARNPMVGSFACCCARTASGHAAAAAEQRDELAAPEENYGLFVPGVTQIFRA